MERSRKGDVLCLLAAAAFALACLCARAGGAETGIYAERERPAHSAPVLALETEGGKIDINSASAETLMLLPGIGEVRSAEIIEYRERHGGFDSVDELLEIDGIGPVILEGLREYVTAEEMP